MWKIRVWLSVLGAEQTVSWERTRRNREASDEEMS
jgi:hypothetical protein